jgi:hypothetical protein
LTIEAKPDALFHRPTRMIAGDTPGVADATVTLAMLTVSLDTSAGLAVSTSELVPAVLPTAVADNHARSETAVHASAPPKLSLI